MSLPTTLSSTIIEGNTVSKGYYTDGGSLLFSEYDRNLYTSLDCIIEKNSFSGQVSDASKNMVVLSNCTCIVQNNTFIRKSNIISSYINNIGTNDHTIVNNIFDSPNIGDGYTESLVTNLTNTSIYEKNINQTDYAAIVMTEFGATHLPPWSWDATNHYGTQIKNAYATPAVDTVYVDSGAIRTASTNPGPQRAINFYCNLSKSLPKNVQVLNSLIGFRFETIAANLNTATTSTISTNLYKTKAAQALTTSFSTPDSTLAQLHLPTTANYNNLETPLTTSLAISGGLYVTTTTNYLTGDYTASSYTTNHVQDLVMTFKYAFSTTASAGTTIYVLSPLLLSLIHI